MLAIVACAPFAIGSLHEYATLCGSLVAYSVSTVICWAMSVGRRERFDFAVIAQRTGDFDDGAEAPVPDRAAGTSDTDVAPEPAANTK
ncbi:hypothetical protein NKH18_09405 [Streptomyces sp. M10(2022)]